MKSFAFLVALLVSACVLRTKCASLAKSEAELQPSGVAEHKTQHTAELKEDDSSSLVPTFFRRKRHTHIAICLYCCNCCSNKKCGYCCKT
ncbi:hepcidin-1 [Latimeria chalumnae]|uniref:hepcidin-1 n=1 Tax=Latimeria chalumnae TaxID=7897 RepID=UPI0003C12F3A|nr:PREDICTED: hepcidin [Latimeria chalumnae]|eukprot:XP_005995729.1 PREDICTED: hepcidin [Latimeria chalumnae]